MGKYNLGEVGLQRGGDSSAHHEVSDRGTSYALDEIEEFEVEEFDWLRTTSAIGAFLGAWFGLLLLAANSS